MIVLPYTCPALLCLTGGFPNMAFAGLTSPDAKHLHSMQMAVQQQSFMQRGLQLFGSPSIDELEVICKCLRWFQAMLAAGDSHGVFIARRPRPRDYVPPPCACMPRMLKNVFLYSPD